MTAETSAGAGEVDAFAIIQLGTGYTRAKLVQSAVEIGLFGLLAKAPATEVEIRTALGIHPRIARDFLDAVVAIGLLLRDGEHYRNSVGAQRFLVPDEPEYVGGFLQLATVLYDAWSQLTATLRRGGPPPEYRPEDLYGDEPKNPEFFAKYVEGMDSANKNVAPELASRIDWARAGSFVDVGGCRGNVAAALVRAHPHLSGTVFDVVPTEPYFHEHMARLGTAGQVRFHVGDFFRDPLPPADVLIFGHVLHDWAAEDRRMLLGKAFDALPPGGSVVVYDRMIDDERTNLPNLLLSLNMIIGTPGGSEYTVGECHRWLGEAGFRVASTETLPTRDVLVVAGKPAR